MIRMTTAAFALTCLLLALGAYGADWAQWLGPNANGIAPDQGINKNWRDKPPKVLWRVSLGDNGYAGPSVAEGKVFIIDHAGDQDVVRALSADTGQDIWRFAYADTSKNDHGYARSTPVFSEGKLYTLSRLGVLNCLNANTGDKIWSRNIKSEFSGQRPKWDYAASPLIDGDKLIVCPGGQTGVAALNKNTGETIWTGGVAGMPGYATPKLATIQGRRQYVIITGETLLAVDAGAGETLWSTPWDEPSYKVNAATPTVEGNFVFVSTGYGVGCGLFEITAQGVKRHWTNKALMAHFNSPVYYNDYFFGIGDRAGLVCISPQNGAVAWQQGGFNKGGVVAVDGVIIAQDGGKGDVVMVNAVAEGYQELGRINPLGGQSWTAPIVANGKLIIRNKGAMACLDLM